MRFLCCSVVPCCLCRLLFVLLYFFFWPYALYYLSVSIKVLCVSDNPFGNFKLFLKSVICLVLHFTLNKFRSCCMFWLLGSKSFWRFMKCKHNKKKNCLPYGSTTIKVMSVKCIWIWCVSFHDIYMKISLHLLPTLSGHKSQNNWNIWNFNFW
jgi:hypothetical protein